MKNLLTILYGILYLALLLGGFFLGLENQSTISISLVGLTFASLFFMIGLCGYVLNKAIFKHSTWKTSFYLLIGITLFSSFVNLNNLFAVFFLCLINTPMAFILHSYSKEDQDIWLKDEEVLAGNKLSEFIEQNESVSYEKSGQDSKHSLSVTNEEGFYIVKINRVSDDKTEEFTERFINPGLVKRYIEQYSMVKFSELLGET
ncbi:hypothetical protein E2K93_01125 [Thalassotalea sp. HSM 43]|uniref:hypothetical protein n=1 Tax=Thalassotalea sp. HSM 43 TaxID=2552945 RepID=UPI0010804880|nr:hypothetical protein [Thalassotalea sp. HSM 43]QBY03055.1 hypothetical protein E2K93_01125 [Thalassotalea sp. HSM 43]